MKNIAIITAGGSGKRLPGKTKKQFVTIAGRPLLFWTLDKFVGHSQIAEIIITLPEEETSFFAEKIQAEFPEKEFIFLTGGKERQESVRKALRKSPSDSDFVLIHDGVRPFVSEKEITRLLEIAKKNEAVIPVARMKDTVKKVSADKIIATIPRENLVRALEKL